jgi:CMP-N-acetylneuraminic acid synthetase
MGECRMKIAIITLLRKGSQRFKNKMMSTLKGKELYKHTTEFGARLQKQIKNSKYYICHDYPQLDIPVQEGVFEIKREEQYTGNIHKTNEEILSYGIDADVYILLQCTSPVRNIESILENIDYFITGKYLCGFSAHRIKDGFYYSSAAVPVNFYWQDRTDNGCEKEPLYKETGSFYIFVKAQLYTKHILSAEIQSAKIIFDDPYNIDIDTEEDLKNADLCCRY